MTKLFKILVFVVIIIISSSSSCSSSSRSNIVVIIIKYVYGSAGCLQLWRTDEISLVTLLSLFYFYIFVVENVSRTFSHIGQNNILGCIYFAKGFMGITFY